MNRLRGYEWPLLLALGAIVSVATKSYSFALVLGATAVLGFGSALRRRSDQSSSLPSATKFLVYGIGVLLMAAAAGLLAVFGNASGRPFAAIAGISGAGLGAVMIVASLKLRGAQTRPMNRTLP
jgi:hypothetical protein